MFNILATKKIQVKTMSKYQLTQVRGAKASKTSDHTYWQGCRERGTLIFLLVCWQELNWYSHYGNNGGDS